MQIKYTSSKSRKIKFNDSCSKEGWIYVEKKGIYVIIWGHDKQCHHTFISWGKIIEKPK